MVAFLSLATLSLTVMPAEAGIQSGGQAAYSLGPRFSRGRREESCESHYQRRSIKAQQLSR